MQSTESTALKKPDDMRKQKTQPTDLKHSEGKQSAESYQLANLSLRTAKRLENCMEVMAKDETLESVKAICMCAAELNKIMKLNLDFYREGM